MTRKRHILSHTAVALLRVSKDEMTQALGVAAQRAAIDAWAARESVEVVAWHLEEVSGSAPLERRPVLAAAVADVEARGAAYLVALKVDRFSRDRLETGSVELRLRRMGSALVFADGAGSGTTPADELVRTVLLGAAAFERATIAARIKAALAVKRARGEMTGAPPYGMRLAADGVHLESDARESAVVVQVVALRAEGRSIREIAAELAARGIVGRAGRPLTRDAVDKVLLRQARAEGGTK